jgi:hypothetical protein
MAALAIAESLVKLWLDSSESLLQHVNGRRVLDETSTAEVEKRRAS